MTFSNSKNKVRILPLTIASLSLLFVAKAYDIYEQGNEFSRLFLGGSAIAEDDDKATKDKVEADGAEDKEDDKQDNKNAEEETAMAPPEDVFASVGNKQFSDIELDILQSLSERREELDQLEGEVLLKESLLESTEVRLNTKIEQIEQLEKTVRKLLEQYDEVEETQIKSLVKIYENMKPKEAARIFNELDMPILLRVVDSMSERRAAPILAKMSPLKAKQLTQELADDRKLRTQQETDLNNIAGQ